MTTSESERAGSDGPRRLLDIRGSSCRQVSTFWHPPSHDQIHGCRLTWTGATVFFLQSHVWLTPFHSRVRHIKTTLQVVRR